ncbi:MAG: hypothetical protein AWM53_02054 [Candidatus Dichloromethanomonas elyunquensis]|nr:MAG: hypothetical protein AWM53_02054 [Candidatus Dichloromethanomonas elyunquensis]
MERSLRDKANRLIRIYKQVHKDYRWKNSSNMNNLIALSYVMKGKDYIKSEVDQVNGYLKKNTGPFSCYRQKSVLFSVLLLLNYSDPEAKFDILLDYEERLKAAGFRSYTYRPVTAYSLLLTCKTGEIDQRIVKAYEIFTEMRRNHPWLTSGDDYPLSILMAKEKESVPNIMANIEHIYSELSEAGLAKSNGLQFLSHILSFSTEATVEKVRKCQKLYEFFKENKLKVYSGNYGSLGLLTLLQDKSEEAAQEIIWVSRVLTEDRGFKRLGKETIFLTSSSLVCDYFLDLIKCQEGIQTTSFITMEALLAAQAAAMLGAACTASAAPGS